jgi:hypothetical protein
MDGMLMESGSMQEYLSEEKIKHCRGLMGVPITFMDKYNPEQFEIIGIDRYVKDNPNPGKRFSINGKETYARILVKRKGNKDGTNNVN